MKKIIALVLSGLAFVSCQSTTSSLIAEGNWADITLEEKGKGSSNSPEGKTDSVSRVELYRAAKADLYKKLETDILNLKIEPRKDVRAFIGSNQKLRDKIFSYLRNAKINEAVYAPGKGMELTGQIYLGEGFKSVLGLMDKKAPEEKDASRPAASPKGPGGF
ncbi:MAG TPA: hypothetical protein VN944_05360 [Nitrospiria bacterium]|nr:hypothetical protein [Nitrospiria bacterium]